MKIVNDASLQPRSGNAPRQIVLWLHGFGSSGSDTIALAPTWQQSLPDALFLAPHAPQPCSYGAGYQWWVLSELSPQTLVRGAREAAPAIDSFIDRKLAQYDLTDAGLAIIGFSRDTMMAFHVGLCRQAKVAAIVGFLTGAAELRAELVSKPPVLLVHGSQDSVVPVTALLTADIDFKKLGIEVTTHVSANLDHSVDPRGIKLGCDFVTKALRR